MKRLIASLCATAVFLYGLFACPVAYAARPMMVDDARIVDPKSCQIESYAKINRDSTEYWALPGCNFTGNFELTSGGAITRSNGETRTTDFVLQGKTLFKVLEPNGWSMGLVFGNVHHPNIQASRNLIGDLYSYIPASMSLFDDHVVMHANLGWTRHKDIDRHRMTWGVGAEVHLFAGHTWAVAEIFSQNQSRPSYQVGVRHWIVMNHVQVDATYGNRLVNSTQDHWFTFGLRLLSLPFLP